jgi:hypothetical protein
MSWIHQFSGSNNIHPNMPPMMNDGRNYSSWQPEAVINEQIQKEAGIKSNWEYRQYLQNNANNIMKYNTMESIYASGNNPYTLVNNETSKNVPFLYTSTHDNSQPKYGFNNSDLKMNYLTREQLQSRMIAPSISTNQF